MKISTRLVFAAWVPAMLALVVIAVFCFSYLEMRTIQNNGNTVREIRSSITELNHLVFSFILYHEDRPKQQFREEYSLLSGQIKAASLRTQDQQRLLDTIKVDSVNMNDLFNQLVSNYQASSGTGPASQEAEDHLVGLLMLNSYEADSDAAQLGRQVDDGLRYSERLTFILVLIFLILAVAPLTIVLIRVRHSITSSLSNLSKGVAVVGSGNLDFKIAEKSGDEIGDLTRSFNQMTSDLKGATTSRSTLEKEIAEHQRAETELSRQEEKFRIIADFTYDWEYWLSPENRFVYVSPSCQRISGYSSAEFLQNFDLFLQIIHPGDMALVQSHLNKDLMAEGPSELEFRIKHKDGTEKWISHVCQTIQDAQGKVLGRRASNRDITMRKRAEEDLVKSEQRWATTLSSIGDGVIATDMNGQVTFMNQVAENLTGWTYLESGAKPINDIFVIINEFSRQKADNPVDKVLAQGITCNLANHTILLRRDGIQVPIDDGASPIKDQAGKMTGVVLIFRDISQRKMTEKALRESEENYRQLFNNMSEGFAHCEMIFDPDGRPIDYRFLNANPRTAEFTGCSADKIIGKTILSIFPHVSPGAIENFGRVISTGQPVHFENYSLDLKRWFDVYAFKAGPAQFAYMLINITERKQAEEALKISNEELTRFNRVSVGRELRMIELKQEINALSIRCGLKPPYPFSSEEE